MEGVNRRETLSGFPEGTDLAVVNRLQQDQPGVPRLKALPPQREQLARSKRIRHVQLDKNAIAFIEHFECHTQLIPGERRRIRFTQVLRNLDPPRWIFGEKILIHGFIENVAQVGGCLESMIAPEDFYSLRGRKIYLALVSGLWMISNGRRCSLRFSSAGRIL